MKRLFWGEDLLKEGKDITIFIVALIPFPTKYNNTQLFFFLGDFTCNNIPNIPPFTFFLLHNSALLKSKRSLAEKSIFDHEREGESSKSPFYPSF